MPCLEACISGHQSVLEVATCRQTGSYAAHTAKGKYLHGGNIMLPIDLSKNMTAMQTVPCRAPPRHSPICCPPNRYPAAQLTWTVKGANFLLFLRCTRYWVVPSLAKSTFSSSLLM